ncbi:MAG: DUF5050 domain-containing protein [Oscillospiraceae bacterium]
MFCVNCGREIENDLKFCPHCGGAQHKSDKERGKKTVMPQSAAKTKSEKAVSARHSKPLNTKLIAAVFATAVVAAAAIAVVLLVKSFFTVTTGNTNANLNGLGAVCESGKYIYYSKINAKDATAKIYRMKKNGTKQELISRDNGGLYINIIGNWIYYSSVQDEKMSFSRMMTDGSLQGVVAEVPCSFTHIEKSRVYYVESAEILENGFDRDSGGQLCTMSLSGQGRKVLVADECCWLNVEGGWIYYINIDKGANIYRARTDGSKQQVLVEESCSQLLVQDGKMYFTAKSQNSSAGGVLCTAKTDGSGFAVTSGEEGASSIAVSEDGLIGFVDADGKACISLTDGVAATVYEGPVYFQWRTQKSLLLLASNEAGDMKLVMCDTDGKNPTQIYAVRRDGKSD